MARRGLLSLLAPEADDGLDPLAAYQPSRMGLLSAGLLGLGQGLNRRRAPGISLTPGGADPGNDGFSDGMAMAGGMMQQQQQQALQRGLLSRRAKREDVEMKGAQAKLDADAAERDRRARLAEALKTGDRDIIGAAAADFNPGSIYDKRYGWEKTPEQIAAERAEKVFGTDEGIRGAREGRAMTDTDRKDAGWRSSLAIGEQRAGRVMTDADRADAEWKNNLAVTGAQRQRAMTPADIADEERRATIRTDAERRGRIMSPEEVDQQLGLVTAKARATEGAKPPTEAQANAGGYLGRMERADAMLTQFAQGKDGVTGGETTSAIANALPGGNMLRSEKQQQVRQAQEDWVRAKLRKESGAVIGEDEMAREIKTYFPQMGDGPKVIAQKEAARATAREAMALGAGKARLAPAPAAAPAGLPPNVNHLLDKYAPKAGGRTVLEPGRPDIGIR